ncbi:homeobox-leucine zipper protein HOX7-like [Musa acuminata AAA Group]|uniref:homeobox-leucine zipper protein HOX7-like n=1 Tax=Musa acuminata AAA Group TaxID=214697 RepID=UPI0031CE918F
MIQEEECDVVLRLAVGGGEKTPVREISERLMRPANEREEAEGTRRKLRLSEEQLSLLEDSFRAHNTLAHVCTPVSSILVIPMDFSSCFRGLIIDLSWQDQKRELAQRLHLQPRRKLKQTEENCESLRKCCQRLTNENRRLKRELMGLRAARLITCSSCEKIARDEKKTINS